ncbi:alpha/beta fold hydrolase [Paenibacillus sp. 1P03SA]|uniref:alpha/beta fold hydrolase n=1 Tax=Paenibacillus sp. 1P03SA TaxID=3132294 RepID=UPI0039A20239
MPLIDLPLEKLKEYQGINPRPSDFDEYWERALAELDSVDPQVELVPSDFQVPYAECFDLYFTGVKGARIHAKYVKPKTDGKPHPAVLQFHGYTGHAGDWLERLPYAALGYSVAALDVRGQGGKSQDIGGIAGNTHHGHIIRGLDEHPDELLFRHVFLDTVRLARIVMEFEEVDGNRVATMGGSQGGALALACAALEPRIRRTAANFPFLSDYKRVWEMDLAKDAYAELRTYFRFFDPQHKREEEVFYKLGYIDIQHLAPRIQADILFGIGLMDTVCPPSTQYAVLNKLKAPVQLEIYPDFAHEGLPGMSDKQFMFLQQL